MECRRRVKDGIGERWETVVYGAGDLVILESIELEVAIARISFLFLLFGICLLQSGYCCLGPI